MGPSRRKPNFESFATQRAPVQWRKIMTSKNLATVPAGFEQTIAERAMPVFASELARGQSLKYGCLALRDKPRLAKHFGRDKGFFGKGGKS